MIKVGQKYGKLTVLKKAEVSRKSPTGRSYGYPWICKCDCGNIHTVVAGSLTNGSTKSCGCLPQGNTKHGHHGTLTYTSWLAMHRRCRELKHKGFFYYGARGVLVCRRWKIFKNFLADMGERPKEATLSRKNNDGNYEPTNCEWCLNHSEQMKNRRNTRWVIYEGQQMTLTDFAKRIGIVMSALSNRARQGWSMEEIVTHYSNPKNWHNKPRKDGVL